MFCWYVPTSSTATTWLYNSIRFFFFLGASATRDGIKLTWTRGNDLPLSEEHDIIGENTLVLKNVQKEDQGVYKCIGYNTYGNIVFSKSVTLRVVGKILFEVLIIYNTFYADSF